MVGERIQKRTQEKRDRTIKYVFTRVAGIRAEVYEQEKSYTGPKVMLDALAELKIAGYLMALLDFGVVGHDDYEYLVREVNRKEVSHKQF